MDRRLPPPPRWRRLALRLVLAAAVLAAAAALLLLRTPAGPTVAAPQLARVVAGTFRDELALRARAEPLKSVQLDATEAGRVDEVLARDGDEVPAGAPLYRLHSPEQEQLWLQRSAEVAQQMANVSLQRTALVASGAANRRELVQLQAVDQQAEAEAQRQTQLAAAGFVSASAAEQAQRQQRLARQLLQQAQQDQHDEARTRQQSVDEMARAVQGLQHGLQLLARSRERLLQRAPMAGRVNGLALQVGASVRAGDRLGRIDDLLSGVQLVAEVDEYHLPRLQVGQPARAAVAELSVAQILPQVQAGKVRVLLRAPAADTLAALRPGQAVDLRLQLSPPTPALLLPDGPGVHAHVYLRQGRMLQRHAVQLGRRAAGQVEVLAGLRAGDEVLISQPPTDGPTLTLP